MGVHLSVVDFNKEFACCSKEPIILNDAPGFSVEDEAALHKLIYTSFSGDMLSNIPSCECGAITDQSNIGVYCRKCNSHVQPVFQSDLQPLTWIRAPHGVDALINPIIWTMLKEVFSVGSFNLIHWICDSSYHPTGGNIPAVCHEIRRFVIGGKPFQQGLNIFIRNFDEVLEKLFDLKFMKRKQRADKNAGVVLRRVLEENRGKVFCKHLPIPHRSILVLETDSLMMYVDPLTREAIDTILLLAGIDTELNAHSTRMKEIRAVKTFDQLAALYHQMYKKQFSEKEGDFRKHVFATRSEFSFRTVISSLTDKHDYREVRIPWGIATSVLKQHLISKLFRLGYTPTEAHSLINDNATTFHPVLGRLFDELIAEAPSGIGISATLNRNPSLERGSIQHVYITQVFKDPNIPTTAISILVVKALNADFDGDALNLTLAIDQVIEDALENLDPHKSSFSLRSPRQLASTMSMPKPVVSTIANWLSYETEFDSAKWEAMKKTFH